MDASLFFAAAAALAIVIYVLADGFDLGVGILFPVAPHDEHRDRMMESIEPIWDGNETWLVFGGTLLFAAFPIAYYVLLPAFYLAIMLMLFALIARGIAFAFRSQTTRFRRVWDVVFAGGSLLAAFCQGLILGGFIQGVPMRDGVFDGSSFHFLTFLGVLCGIGLIGGYALLGAGWLIWRTTGSLQTFAREVGHSALIVAASAMVLVSAWTSLTQDAVASRWFDWPNIAFLVPVPILTAILVVAIWRSLWLPNEKLTLLLSIGLFLLGFAGLVVSLWPYIIPWNVTIWDGVTDAKSQLFVGVGIALIMPIVLAYQAFAYWVFRGKLDGHQRVLGAPFETRNTFSRGKGLHFS
jgi:cytochrome bd ubiquinol oxidase subunit II